MRYILQYVRPGYGPSVGSSNTIIREYASDRTALRYMHLHLRDVKHFPAGQYKLSRWPSGTFTEGKEVGYLYKTA